MSKKLLEESTIRSFMKLANLQPLTAKFLKEAEEESKAEEEAEEEDEEEDEEEEDEGKVEESSHVTMGRGDKDRTQGRDVPQDRLTEESEEEQDEVKKEGKESEGRPASKKEAPKGTSLAGKTPGKMDAAKNAPGDAKLKPMKQTHVHSDKPDSIQHTEKSNAPKKNNSTFEVVSESLEEEMDEVGAEAPESSGDMGSAGETAQHQDKMKELIRGMLNTLKDMGAEYGMSMEISDESAAASPEGGEEMAPPAPETAGEEEQEDEMKMHQLDEMVEKLTKRVAARLVKDSKKKH